MINLAHRDINRFSGVKYACNSAIHYYKVIHSLFLVQRIKSPTLCLPTCPTSYNSVKLTAYRGHSNQKKAHCHYMKKRWCAPDLLHEFIHSFLTTVLVHHSALCLWAFLVSRTIIHTHAQPLQSSTYHSDDCARCQFHRPKTAKREVKWIWCWTYLETFDCKNDCLILNFEVRRHKKDQAMSPLKVAFIKGSSGCQVSWF